MHFCKMRWSWRVDFFGRSTLSDHAKWTADTSLLSSHVTHSRSRMVIFTHIQTRWRLLLRFFLWCKLIYSLALMSNKLPCQSCTQSQWNFLKFGLSSCFMVFLFVWAILFCRMGGGGGEGRGEGGGGRTEGCYSRTCVCSHASWRVFFFSTVYFSSFLIM